MENSRANSDLVILVSLIALVMLATGNLWGPVEPSEARYTEISREMFRSGDWLHPTLLNIHHYHKPPLTYWITAASYSVFGVNPFAARFFLVIAYCLQVFLVFKVGKMLFKDPLITYFATLIYATLPIVLISVRALTTDAYLNLFVLWSLFLWFKFMNTGKILFYFIACFATGLGFATKGPVILIVPLFAVAGSLKFFRRPQLNFITIVSGLLVFIVVGFSWFAYLIEENSLFADYFLFHHIVDRVAHAEVFSRSEPWYYYLPVIPLVTLPWIGTFLKATIVRGSSHSDHDVVKSILIWWFAIPLIVFSVSSSKLVLYILPLSIGFSFVAAFAASLFSRKSLTLFLVLMSLVSLAMIVAPFFVRGINSAWLIAVPAISILLAFGTTLASLPLVRTNTIVAGLFAISLLLYSSLLFHYNGDVVNTTTSLCRFINQKGMSDRQIVIYNELLPSVAFELEKEIVSIYAGNRALKREIQFEQDSTWKNTLIDTTGKAGANALHSMLRKQSVIIAKNELPSNIQSLMEGEWNKEKLGKWTLYYN